MFEILVVDDEPTGLNHVCMILKKKCPQYTIMATAENGEQAMEIIRQNRPDILITDIKMPVMDGLQLVSKVKKEYPEVLSVIVSGYSEFEYAKGAIQSGVCDYLLKPLVPSDMQRLMEELEVVLKNKYYEKRISILRNLCNGRQITDIDMAKKYFPSGFYYAVIFRQNGLPRRFSKKNGIEIFSMEEEKIYIYGRDTMEALYLMPHKLMFEETFDDVVIKLFEKEKKKGSFVTGVVYPKEFTLESLTEVARWLYRKLDERIVVGKTQLWQSGSKKENTEWVEGEKKKLEYIENLIRYRDSSKLLREMHKLFEIWNEGNSTQLQVEARIQHLFRVIESEYQPEHSFAETEFGLDDIFCQVADMTELEENVIELMKLCIPDMGKERIDNKEQFFRSIVTYLNAHLKEEISLGTVCREFGVSQTSLSRLFRIYQKTSFSNYLTQIRIEKAKKMMEEDHECYIKDVAERCGYADQFYFSRIFRSVVGMCPKEYIEEKSKA